MNNKKIEEIIKEFNKELCCSFDVEDENGIKTGEKTFALKNIANQKPIIDFITKKLTQIHNSAIEGCVEMIEEEIKDAKQFVMPGLVSGSSPQALAQIDVLLRLKQKLKIK